MAPWRFSGGPNFSIDFFCSLRIFPSDPPRPIMSSNPIGGLLQHHVLAHVGFVELLQRRGRLARLRRVRRKDDLEDDVEVAAGRACRSALERGEPAPAQAQLAAALGARGDLQLHGSFERRRGDLGAAERLGRGDRQVEQQVAPLHAHGRVLANGDAQVEIPGFGAALPRTALAGQPDAGACLHSRRDLHLEARGLRDGARSGAARAGVADGAFALATRAGRAEQPAHPDLAGTVALRAGLRPAAGPCSAPLALRAAGGPVQGDLALGAEHGVAQVDGDRRLDVLAGGGFGRPAGAAGLPPGEDVAEHGSEVGGVESRSAAATHALEAFEPLEPSPTRGARPILECARLLLVEARARRDLAELVVQRTLLRIAEDLEGGRDLLEPLLRLLVPRVHVRVQLLRQLAIRLLDLLGGRGLRHTEKGVRVLHHDATVTTWLGVVKSATDKLTPVRMGRYHPCVRAAILVFVLLGAGSGARAADRRLVDEVVAVVDAHSITLSEVEAETRVRLVAAKGAAGAAGPLDRRLLAASLRRTIEERVVLSEVQRLKLFDLEPAEVESLVAGLRAKFANAAEYEAFTRSLELTDDEIAAVLS